MVKGVGGVGMKAPDFAAVPVCRECHDIIQPDSNKYPQLRWLIETLSLAFAAGVFREGSPF